MGVRINKIKKIAENIISILSVSVIFLFVIFYYFGNDIINSPLFYGDLGGIFVGNLTTGEKNINLIYTLNGDKGYINYVVYRGLKDHLQGMGGSVTYNYIEPTDKDFIMKKLNNKKQDELLFTLVDKIKNKSLDKDNQVRIAISLVQNIPYDYAGLSSLDSDGKYPYEVIYDGRGVCGEKSELLAYLLRGLGYGVVLFEYTVENHRAVGIKCPVQYSYKNSGYCFIESTTPSIITDDQLEYPGFGKLIDGRLEYTRYGKLYSTPEIIYICDGISFNSVSEEYQDTQKMVELNKLAENSGGFLYPDNYEKWEFLMDKYGIRNSEE